MKSSAPATQQPIQIATNNLADGDDQQVLQAISNLPSDVRSNYEQGLRDVNASIADAQHTVDENPGDGDAKEFLMQAYRQKAILYQMAAHSGE
jgi:hypothetical protein